MFADAFVVHADTRAGYLIAMRFWKPMLELDESLPRQTAREEAFGGRPWGLPESRWPRCAECGKSMSLVAQLNHASGRLELGRPGRAMFVFQCNHDPGMCDTWAAGSGANAAFVLEPEEIANQASVPPADAGPEDLKVRVVDWVTGDDGVAELDRAKFRSDSEYVKLPEEALARVEVCTRIGGVPSWIQSASEAPDESWAFALQIDSSHRIRRGTEGERSCQGSNFGDAGVGYVFVRHAGDAVPEALFFWQCG